MRKFQRKKLKKILIISGIVILVIALIVGIIIYINSKNKEEEILYEDTITANHYFTQITIDFANKEVLRDDIETSLQEEFNISEEQENLMLNSQEELLNYFSNNVFDVNIKENIVYITNKYQTKKIIMETDTIRDDFEAENVTNLENGMYILEYDTQKRTKAAYEYFEQCSWLKKVENDEVLLPMTINDESQTVYGEEQSEEQSNYNTYGVQAMGLDNFQNIIRENGNASEIVVATLGYGVCIENEYFNGRINENYYNFLSDSKDVSETIPQGSRIAEVIKECTPENVKIMPLVVVNSEGYTTISAIVRALDFGTKNSDIICYELVNNESDMINLALENAFKENVPVSCVTTNGAEDKQIYPANNSRTIAVSSIDKNSVATSYSAKGDYIDFSAYSTDIEEIFNSSTTVSKWSGSQYSNAHIAATMALIKSYFKDYTILELYNVLRNFCVDLGEEGKDDFYGYGCPNFSNITIADIDKQVPEIKEIRYDNERWESIKKVQIIASDNIRLSGWAITNSEAVPTNWNMQREIKSTLDVTVDITGNGSYYIWILDSAGNTSYTVIQINRIDTTGPTIQYNVDDSTLETENYVTISVNAQDSESGLNQTPYSWDGMNWGTESNILKVTENGRYKVYVRDALGNMSESEIIVDKFPMEGVANIDEGPIIKSITVSADWNEDINNNVRITFNEGLNIVGWRITNSDGVPNYFEEIESNNNVENENEEDNTNDEENVINNNIENENSVNENSIDENLTDNNSVVENDAETIEPEVQGYNSSFTVTRKLRTNTTYYVWIKDADGKVLYQTFSIGKAQI